MWGKKGEWPVELSGFWRCSFSATNDQAIICIKRIIPMRTASIALINRYLLAPNIPFDRLNSDSLKAALSARFCCLAIL